MQTFTLACFWFATLVFVWCAWMHWRAYTRWRHKYEELLREDYLREFREEC